MSDTKIEWAKLGMPRGKSVNPIRAFNIETGQEGHFCVPKSDGCKLCYASNWNTSPRGFGTRIAFAAQNRKKVRLEWREDFGLTPFRSKQPAGWFPCDMTDWLGHDFGLPLDLSMRVLAMCVIAPWHRYFLLTKRYDMLRDILVSPALPRLVGDQIDLLGLPERDYSRGPDRISLSLRSGEYSSLFNASNLWFGVSICNPKDAGEAILPLGAIRNSFKERGLPQPIIGVSYEPALAGIDWTLLSNLTDWLIIGGESDQAPLKARRMDPDWALRGIETYHARGKPVFVKQAGNRLAEEWGCTGKGVDPAEWPEQFRVREYPEL